MRARTWIVAAFIAGFLWGCSSEKHQTTQNPEGAPDGNVANDTGGDVDRSRCTGIPAQPAHRRDPTTCAASAGGPGLSDQCTTDDQCPPGAACGCATDFSGNAIHVNVCMNTGCRVDSDCGPGGVCSPSFTGHCSSLTGYYCHSAADDCTGHSDCCVDPARQACQYSPELGHWTCQAVIPCNG